MIVREVVMNNANAVIKACVWCGAAFLRGPWWLSSNPNERCGSRGELTLPRRNAEGSIPSPRTNIFLKKVIRKRCQEPFPDLMVEDKGRHGLRPSMNFGVRCSE
jgi:hypothetical protein